ncbi:hypothetical protein [Streptomyces sp. NPDC004008]
MTARVRQALAPVGQFEILVDDLAFTSGERFAEDAAFGVDDGGEEAAGERAGGAAGVLSDLCLLVGVESGRGIDYEEGRIQSVPRGVDPCLLGERRAAEGPGHMAAWICSPSASNRSRVL